MKFKDVLETKEYLGVYAHEGHHKETIETHIDQDLYTIILYQAPSESHLFEDPKHFKKIPVTHNSEVEQHVLKEEMYRNWDFLHDIISKHYPNLKEENSKEYWKEFDHYLKGCRDSKYPQAAQKILDEWAFFKWLDDGGDEERLEKDLCWELESVNTIIKHQKEYDKKTSDIYLPQYTYNYKRLLDSYPKPIQQATHYITMQLYMIDLGGILQCSRGYGAGSGTRFNQGYYGHLFAELVKKGNSIKSYICNIDSEGNLTIDREEDKLLLLNTDLTGNYQIDKSESEDILNGIELV